MHELNLARDVLRRCTAHLERPPGRIVRVRLAVGELSAVEPDLLRFAWEAVTSGGPDRGSTLDVDWRPARQTCETCGAEADRPAGSWLADCPRCGGPLRIDGGQELDVLEFAYRSDEPVDWPAQGDPTK